MIKYSKSDLQAMSKKEIVDYVMNLQDEVSRLNGQVSAAQSDTAQMRVIYGRSRGH